MKDYTNTSPSYNSKVPEFDTTDKGHADILNQAVEQLANNTFANHDAIDKVKDPTYDTSDTSTITSFPTFLSKFVTGLNIFKFFADLKAGLAYVLHTGNIVNNCVSTSTGNVLDAYQGKVLQDNITAEATARAAADTQLNSKLMIGTTANLTFNGSVTESGSTGGLAKIIGRIVWVSGYFKTSWYGDSGALVNIANAIPVPSLNTYFSCSAKGKPAMTGFVTAGERSIKFNLEAVTGETVYFNFTYPID